MVLIFVKLHWTSQGHNYAPSDEIEDDESAIHVEWPELQRNANRNSVRQCGAVLADDIFANTDKHKLSINDLRNPYIIHKMAVTA
jgi:hypothetical protein